MATSVASVCGHPVVAKRSKWCRSCYDNRGTKMERGEPRAYASQCGHPATMKGAKFCRACYDQRRAAIQSATPAEPRGESLSVTGDSAEVTKTTRENVRTLADLIRVCEIDTEEWQIERWVANKWEAASKNADGDIETTPLYQVKVWLKRHDPVTLTMTALREQLVADIKAAVAKHPRDPVRHRYVDSGYLFEFSPVDLHMGKYAWDEETVSNYDTDIASDLFDQSLEFLLSRALKMSDGKLSRILCVFGNDVAHTDGKTGETTRGTRVDVDTRYIRVYRRICAVHRMAIDRLRQIAPVDVKIVPGNHDELTSFHLGEVLATRYDGVRHVTVDNAPRLRKYYDYGVNLFGFTHGDSEKVQELPLLMAREVPELWSRCRSREWHIGHRHVAEKFTWREQDLFSDKGVRVRRLSSLSAADAWHVKHAYLDRRACDGFLFHKDAGYTSTFSFNADHVRPTGKTA